jgi:iron complex outermembrane recepter protein
MRSTAHWFRAPVCPNLARPLLIGLAVGLISSVTGWCADESLSLLSATYLKRLSLDELLAMDVTTVSRRPEPFARAASAISVLTGDDIRRSGATTLADALRYSTGLEVARIDGRTWGIASRGFNVNASNKLLVMMDGRSLYTPLFSGVFWDVQDTELADIDRIEVVRGPGATMWGADAINGVINIQTKNARDTQGTLLTVGGGDEERQFASVREGVQLGHEIYARVYAKEFHRDDMAFPNGADANDDWKMTQGGFRVDAHSGAPDAVTAQGDLYHGFLGASNRLRTRVAGGNLLGRWSHTIEPDRILQTQFYFDRVERTVPLQFSERRNTFDLDSQLTTPLGAHQHLVVGATARTSRDETGTTGTIQFSPANRRMTVFSGLVQDEIRFWNDRLGVTLGAKAEHNNSSGFEFEPSVRIAWRESDRQTIWTAVSRAVRAPTRFDDDLRFRVVPSSVFVSGNPDFRSEKLIAYEAGYRVQPRPTWSIDVDVFYNRYDDLRSQERATSPGVFFMLGNKLNADNSGGELSIAWQCTSFWRLRAMYAHLHKQLSLDRGSTDPTGGLQEGNDPKDMATLTSTIDLPRGWEFDASARYVGALPSPIVPAYTELDLRLGWRPVAAWEFSLAGQNLLHRQHREFGAASPTAHELQRGVYAKVTWRH